jgi:hypothetical protein
MYHRLINVCHEFGFSSNEQGFVQSQRRFLQLMTISNESTDYVDRKVYWDAA